MNTEHIHSALSFLFSGVRDYIVLQVPSADDISKVKRYLSHTLRDPDKIIGNVWWYHNKPIIIRSVGESTAEYNDNNLFYVGWQGGHDDEYLEQIDFAICDNPYPIMRLWQSIGMYPSDMAKALMVDGYGDLQSELMVFKHLNQV